MIAKCYRLVEVFSRSWKKNGGIRAKQILQELSHLLDVSSCLDPRFQLHCVVNKDKTIQQIKSEALEVAGTITNVCDHCELNSSIPPVTKR